MSRRDRSDSDSSSDSRDKGHKTRDSGLKILSDPRKEYEKIPDQGPFYYPGLIRFYNIPDNNSLLRAILNASFIPYRTGIKDGKPYDRDKLIYELRIELSNKLSAPIGTDLKILSQTKGSRHLPSENLTYYDMLSRGGFIEMSRRNHEYSLSNMKKYLESDAPLGLLYLEFLSNALDIDIYIIDLLRLDIYIPGKDAYFFKDRNSVVLGMIDDHFETLGIKKGKKINTYFTHDAPFIDAIWKRKKEIKAKKGDRKEEKDRRGDRRGEKDRKGDRKDEGEKKKKEIIDRRISPSIKLIDLDSQ